MRQAVRTQENRLCRWVLGLIICQVPIQVPGVPEVALNWHYNIIKPMVLDTYVNSSILFKIIDI